MSRRYEYISLILLYLILIFYCLKNKLPLFERKKFSTGGIFYECVLTLFNVCRRQLSTLRSALIFSA